MAIDPEGVSTLRVGQLPTAAFNLTDLIPHEVGTDLKSGTIEDLVALIRLNSNAFQYELKHLRVTNQYVVDNFNNDGLGKNLCLGWKIATLDGRVLVSYGATYNLLGALGGSKDAVVVEHSHAIKYASTGSGTKYPESPYIGDTIGGDMQNTQIAGVSGTNKNMQPYEVVLTIQKL